MGILLIAIMDKDFNQFIMDSLSDKIEKRKKNEFEFVKILQTAKKLLQNQIYQTKRFETLFKIECWTSFVTALEGFEISNNGELEKVTLELLQLFSIITPKGTN